MARRPSTLLLADTIALSFFTLVSKVTDPGLQQPIASIITKFQG